MTRKAPSRSGERAVVAAVLVFGTLVTGACGIGTTAAPTAPPPTVIASASAIPSPTPASVPLSQLRWSAPASLSGGDALHAITQWNGGFVAVGQTIDGAKIVGASFASNDGLRWQRTTVLPVLLGQPTVFGRTLLALGQSQGTATSSDVWISADGRGWQRDDRLTINAANVGPIAARGSIAVAIAVDDNGIATSWFTDGSPWQKGPGLAGRAVIRSLATVTDGFVALGRDGDPDRGSGVGVPGSGRPAAWWSNDGRAWTPLRVEGVVAPGAQLADLFRVKGGYLAVGSDSASSSRAPMLWSSSDGKVWKLVGAPAHWGIAGSTGDTLLVFARDPKGDLEAWATIDGQQWSMVAFSGDTADIPPFEVSPTRSGRVDMAYVTAASAVIVGQRNGQITMWLADIVP